MAGAWPNLIVIGAMKAGTTALHSALDQHPQIQMSRTKELNFFCSSEDLSAARAQLLRNSLQWQRGPDWYRRQFDASVCVRGESSPTYTSPEHHGVARRMFSVIPEAKLILVVRDPIARSISQYCHNVLEGVERRPIDEALSDTSSGYLIRSQYHLCLRPFLEFYDTSQIKVLTQERMSSDLRGVLRETYQFLGVDLDFWDESGAGAVYETASRKQQTAAIAGLRKSVVASRIIERLSPQARAAIKRALSRSVPPGALPSVITPATRAIMDDFLRADAAEFAAFCGANLFPPAGPEGTAPAVAA